MNVEFAHSKFQMIPTPNIGKKAFRVQPDHSRNGNFRVQSFHLFWGAGGMHVHQGKSRWLYFQTRPKSPLISIKPYTTVDGKNPAPDMVNILYYLQGVSFMSGGAGFLNHRQYHQTSAWKILMYSDFRLVLNSGYGMQSEVDAGSWSIMTNLRPWKNDPIFNTKAHLEMVHLMLPCWKKYTHITLTSNSGYPNLKESAKKYDEDKITGKCSFGHTDLDSWWYR